MSKRGTDKEISKILDLLVKQGWRVVQAKSGHWRCFAPDGVTIVGMSGTPGAYTAMANWKAQLKRAGAKLDPEGKARCLTPLTGVVLTPANA